MPSIKKSIKRRKRKRHYKTGIHHSPKCSIPIRYRSGWELIVAKTLDSNPDVISYEYESIQIPYVTAGKHHDYYPDFIITYKSGKRVIVEVKRQDKVANRVVVAKAAAARRWITEQNNGWTYEIWTDAVVEAFKKILEIKNNT